MPTRQHELRRAMQQAGAPLFIVVMKRICWATERFGWEPRAIYNQQSRQRAEYLAASYGIDDAGNPCGKLVEIPNLSHTVTEE